MLQLLLIQIQLHFNYANYRQFIPHLGAWRILPMTSGQQESNACKHVVKGILQIHLLPIT